MLGNKNTEVCPPLLSNPPEFLPAPLTFDNSEDLGSRLVCFLHRNLPPAEFAP